MRVEAVTRPTGDFSAPERFESRPAGAATVFKSLDANAFSHSSGNMSFERELDFKVGDAFFRKIWVSSPSSTVSSDGLGPLFNARGCQSCHLKDGRGRPPAPGERAVSMFLRLSIPPQDETQREALASGRQLVIPEPVYGGQLQNRAIQGHPAEGQMTIRYQDQPVSLADGTVVTLRKPHYSVTELGYGPMHPEVMLSPRVAPPVIGMGLIESIAAEDIEAWADPADADGDGISGRPNRVWSDEHRETRLGRFGWKAGKATVAQQAAAAFRGDMGLSTVLFPQHSGDCSAAQRDCLSAPTGVNPGDGAEVTDEMFELLLFYTRNLAVPARRDPGASRVLEGKRLFYASGCAQCHRPKFVTRRDAVGEEQSFQLIWPYSDFLLHDMGEGLADGRPEGRANGREWRTPPLWGIGLTETVNGHTRFLHDGRARNLLEAVLWHGGEAAAARARVIAMARAEREALIAFLESL
ncbi:di-heme oxidoredictase family protein [Alkalilimnicola sp. S0819]|uniref:di-heme oxidoreductase family protein n=1 Tax=Alkalilimnicola sp. S0819 TaxID=2613922 RepID=UPI0012618566|nr:di-heme oxidoredictase family protein [Alkalilimnicola sp. S0819]KAB7627297.1 c-type cytochrome [Alkalilimnicola sp. S0819]MPQ16011.1 c-type cytochrome [Alkalilimnicola sp. S0819]